MKFVYDYMFHLLSEYSKLLKYKPAVPPGAVEVCSETMVCSWKGLQKKYKLQSMVKTPSYKGSTCLASNHVLSLILYLNVIITVA